MQFGELPIAEAEGHILAHKLFSAEGKRLLNKGHRLNATDVQTLNAHNIQSVTVAQLAPTDLHENVAAKLIGEAVAGEHVSVKAPGVGRANLTASVMGPVRINVPLLDRINNVDEGITIATVRDHSLIDSGTMVALVKIIPFGVAEDRVKDVVAMAQEFGPVMSIRPLEPCRVALLITGPTNLHTDLIAGFTEPVRARITALGSSLEEVTACEHNMQDIATAIQTLAHNNYDLITIAGYSAVMDRGDVVPSALKLAEGSLAHFGVPVDPGSLMMLGYIDTLPVLGLPGCVKSPKFSVIDMVLPRLLSGERLTRADLVMMGHGGLLPDIKQRPMPR